MLQTSASYNFIIIIIIIIIIIGKCAYYDKFPHAFPNFQYDWCEIDEGRDFFAYNKEVNAIITNPPYSLINKFLKHCVTLKPKFISFLLLVIHLNTNRLKMMNENGYALYHCHILTIRNWFPCCIMTFIRRDVGEIIMSDNCIEFTTEIFKTASTKGGYYYYYCYNYHYYCRSNSKWED